MKTARICTNICLTLVAAITAATLSPAGVGAAAGGPQNCTVNTSCIVGEFLYNDSYAPITDASCTLTSRDPSGEVHLNAQAMTTASDGWYSHTFTAPATTGYYRAQVCCTSGSEYLCIDKSFEVVDVSASSSAPSADEIAQEVWGYSSRTLSGFGTLASDVWNNSSRSLTSFGSLVSNIWDSASRTLTGTQATNITNINSDISGIEAKVNENRLLLEQLVNKPIIETSLEEEEDIPDISKKIEETKTVANQIYINEQFITSKIDYLINKWNILSEEEVLSTVMELNKMTGEENDKSANTLLGQVNWLKSSWNWQQADDISVSALAVKKTLSSVQTLLGTYSGSSMSKTKANSTLKDLRSVSMFLGSMEKLVGDSTNQPTQKTLFGKIKETEKLASVLDLRGSEVDNLLGSWDKSKNLDKKVEDLSVKILAVNKIPNASIVLTSSVKDIPVEKILKNKLLGLRALIGANKKLLARGAGVSFANTWLEEGSVVFKTLITNPSTLISQEVPLKYYLPTEVKEEDILETAEGLKVSYDAERSQYFVEGNFKLSAGETKTLSVRVQDIWEVTSEEVDSLRKQADELSRPLEKTSFFAQGVTLKSDINVALDKIVSIQKQAITPEQKIRAYREAQIELAGVTEKMDKLKELVTQAGSTGTMFGFVGGAQAMAVWGLIIIMAAGFVFLALYMKMIAGHGDSNKVKKAEEEDITHVKVNKNKSPLNKAFKALLPFIIVGFLTALISGLTVRSAILGKVKLQKEVSADQTVDTSTVEVEDELSEGVGGEETVMVTTSSEEVKVYQEADKNSEVIVTLENNQEASKVDEKNEMVKIVFEKSDTLELITEGWVESKFVFSPETDEEITGSASVTIKETNTGWLRVRKAPDGVEVARVNPGESFNLLGQDSGWYQIELQDGTVGWVSSEFASINE